jgi:hypothetical protein
MTPGFSVFRDSTFRTVGWSASLAGSFSLMLSIVLHTQLLVLPQRISVFA